jgi:hypothetical protein
VLLGGPRRTSVADLDEERDAVALRDRLAQTSSGHEGGW